MTSACLKIVRNILFTMQNCRSEYLHVMFHSRFKAFVQLLIRGEWFLLRMRVS